MNQLEVFGEALAVFAVKAEIKENDSFSALAFLNWFGCAMAGAREQSVELFASFYEEDCPGGIQPPIGRRKSVSPAACAAVDCMSSAVLAYDDIHFPTSLHPCGPVASAILALARVRSVSGADALRALKIGMEVECRVAETIFSPGTGADKGWYTTGIAGGIGAAAAVGRLLGLDVEHMKSALGLAAARASGTRGIHTAMSFCLAPAVAAESGYTAARLAEKGFTCQIKSLAGTNSLISMIAPNANVALGMDGLGTMFHCEETACKQYPFGFVTYASIKCATDLFVLMTENGKQMERLEVLVSPISMRLGGSPWPENIYDSIVCLRYVVAGVLENPEFAYTPVSGNFSIPPKMARLMNRITISANEELTDNQAVFKARFTDGSSAALRCDAAPGSEKLPPSAEAVIAKFVKQASTICPRQHVEQMKETLLHLETVRDVSVLLRG